MTDTTSSSTHGLSKRPSQIRPVKLQELTPHPKVQRQYREAHAQKIAANLDLDALGYPVVSKRKTDYLIIDGQHRVAAVKMFGFQPDDTLDCRVYSDLTEQDEAELFLLLKVTKAIDAQSGFKVSVIAGRGPESVVDRIVRHLGLAIGQRSGRVHATSTNIAATATLLAVYERIGNLGLEKTLRIVRDAYGGAGLEAPMIEGMSLCVQRYDGTLDEGTMIKALSETPGGLNGLLNQAEKTRLATGAPRRQCIASTAVDIYNRHHGNKKGRLAPWWKE